jgi:hypothetical protein
MLHLHLIVSLIYFVTTNPIKNIARKVQPKKRDSFKITVLKQASRPVCYDGEDIYYFSKFYSGNTKTLLKNI